MKAPLRMDWGSHINLISSLRSHRDFRIQPLNKQRSYDAYDIELCHTYLAVQDADPETMTATAPSRAYDQRGLKIKIVFIYCCFIAQRNQGQVLDNLSPRGLSQCKQNHLTKGFQWSAPPKFESIQQPPILSMCDILQYSHSKTNWFQTSCVAVKNHR